MDHDMQVIWGIIMAAQAGAGVIWAWGQNDQWYGFEDADRYVY